MKQLLSSGFRPVLRPEAEMLLRLRSPNDDTAKVRTKLREAGVCPTRTRMALSALLFSKGDRHVTAEGRGLVHGGSAFFCCARLFLLQPAGDQSTDDAADDRRDPEQPKRPKRHTAAENGGRGL